MKFRLFLCVVLCWIALPTNAKSDMERFYQALDFKAAGQYKEAVQIWRDLAERRHVRSQFYLGLMYDEGKGVKQSDKLAIQWYQKAASRVPDALLNLGNIFAKHQAYHQAIDYYNKSNAMGHKPAKANLHSLLEYLQNYRLHTTKDASLYQKPSFKAKVLRKVAANTQGYEVRAKGRWVKVSLPGQPHLGWLPLKALHSQRILYEKGVKAHTFGQPAQAYQLWKSLAESGHAKSQIMLARLYLEGEGVARNLDKAIFWSEQALTQGALSAKVRAFTQQTIRIAKNRRKNG